MSTSDTILSSDILSQRDEEFRVFFASFEPFYKHAYLGALNGFKEVGPRWALLAMEVMRGVGRSDQLDAVLADVIGRLQELIDNLRGNSSHPSAEQGVLSMRLMIRLMDARLREDHTTELVQLFDAVSTRGQKLGKDRLEPPQWGQVDWRPFSEREVSSNEKMLPCPCDADDRESQLISVHLKHTMALFDSGLLEQEEIIAIYVSAGWSAEAAQALARNALLMSTTLAMTENIRATNAAQALLGQPSGHDDHTKEGAVTWAPALHRALSFDSQDRRNLNRLAAVVRESLHGGMANQDLVQKMITGGIGESSATEFVNYVCQFTDTLERGLDYSILLKKMNLFERGWLFKRRIGEAARAEIIENIVREARTTGVAARGYVLYLRAFQGDENVVDSTGFASRLLGKRTGVSYEQLISGLLLQKRGLPFGLKSLEEKSDPVRTESFRSIPRVHSSNESWKEDVLGAIISSDLVFIRFDRTPGLSWEVQRAFELVPPERLLIGLPDASMLPGGEFEAADIAAAFRRISEPFIGLRFKWNDASETWRDALFVTFSPDWMPKIFRDAGQGSAAKRVAQALDDAIGYSNRFL